MSNDESQINRINLTDEKIKIARREYQENSRFFSDWSAECLNETDHYQLKIEDGQQVPFPFEVRSIVINSPPASSSSTGQR